MMSGEKLVLISVALLVFGDFYFASCQPLEEDDFGTLSRRKRAGNPCHNKKSSEIPTWPSERHCPNECYLKGRSNHNPNTGNKCRSAANQYKCAAFFYFNGTLPQSRPYRWIAGLPDILSKKSVRENQEILDTLGPYKTRGDYVVNGCNDELGSSRCFTIMNDASEFKLEDCDKSIINEQGADSYGDVLCKNLYNNQWITNSDLDSSNMVRDITIRFRYSACGSDWKDLNAIGDDGNLIELGAKQRLCCQKSGNSFYYIDCGTLQKPSTSACV